MKKFIILILALVLLMSCAPKGVSLEHVLAPYIAKYGQPMRVHMYTWHGGLQEITCRTYNWKNGVDVEVDSGKGKSWWVESFTEPLLEGINAGN
jgi:hypothetical protein